MNRYSIAGKTVFVSGATSGIGKSCAESFAAQKCHLVITGRRMERLQSLAEDLRSRYSVRVKAMALDVRDNTAVGALAQTLESEGEPIDILVNNAGLALGSDLLQEGKIEYWDQMIDTNVKGLLYVTRAFVPGMIKRNHGHIINIGSVAGHGAYQGGNVYAATKHAVKALSRSLRLDLMGTAIRVSEVDPGAVNTEFSVVRWKDQERADKFYADFIPLLAEDIADNVLYCATRPPHVNIAELLVYPQSQASLTNIVRNS